MSPIPVRYEVRRLGVLALALPVLVILVFGALALLMALARARAGPIGLLLSGSLEIMRRSTSSSRTIESGAPRRAGSLPLPRSPRPDPDSR